MLPYPDLEISIRPLLGIISITILFGIFWVLTKDVSETPKDPEKD